MNMPSRTHTKQQAFINLMKLLPKKPTCGIDRPKPWHIRSTYPLLPPPPPHSLRAGILGVPSPQTLPAHSSACYRFAFFAFPSAPASLPRLPAVFSVLTRPAACSARSHASAASFVPSGAG